MSTTNPTRAHLIGQLCVGGDWACAHGDVSGLRDVAERLCQLENETLHHDLRAIADACTKDPDRATKLWLAVRDRLYEVEPEAR